MARCVFKQVHVCTLFTLYVKQLMNIYNLMCHGADSTHYKCVLCIDMKLRTQRAQTQDRLHYTLFAIRKTNRQLHFVHRETRTYGNLYLGKIRIVQFVIREIQHDMVLYLAKSKNASNMTQRSIRHLTLLPKWKQRQFTLLPKWKQRHLTLLPKWKQRQLTYASQHLIDFVRSIRQSTLLPFWKQGQLTLLPFWKQRQLTLLPFWKQRQMTLLPFWKQRQLTYASFDVFIESSNNTCILCNPI